MSEMPFSGEGCDIEELEYECIHCGKFFKCIEDGKVLRVDSDCRD